MALFMFFSMHSACFIYGTVLPSVVATRDTFSQSCNITYYFLSVATNERLSTLELKYAHLARLLFAASSGGG
jgi:hypothetical protein